jgi:formate dehydrogenase (NADP+) alpha subunit
MTGISLTIDGRQVEAKEGSTILEAARSVGIRIPTLCHDASLEPYGGCRLCIVKVEGMRGMPPSCITQAADGMKVTTEDDEILRTRQMVMRLLLADHPADCLSCKANLNCELQRLAQDLGVHEHGLIPLERSGTLDESNPVFIRDMNRCILCARCVKTCEEILGLGAIHFIHRGHGTEVGTFLGTGIKESVCESCGECVEHCPTGALQFRAETPAPKREVKTICQYCGTGCGIWVGVRNGKVIRVRGDQQSPVNRGNLCVKGRFGSIQYVNDSSRLTSPLVRKNGKLQEASWDEALDLVVEKLGKCKGDSFAAFSSAKVATEDNYIMQKFTRAVMETNSVDHCARL